MGLQEFMDLEGYYSGIDLHGAEWNLRVLLDCRGKDSGTTAVADYKGRRASHFRACSGKIASQRELLFSKYLN